jgi:hypothetical protein
MILFRFDILYSLAWDFLFFKRPRSRLVLMNQALRHINCGNISCSELSSSRPELELSSCFAHHSSMRSSR